VHECKTLAAGAGLARRASQQALQRLLTEGQLSAQAVAMPASIQCDEAWGTKIYCIVDFMVRFRNFRIVSFVISFRPLRPSCLVFCGGEVSFCADVVPHVESGGPLLISSFATAATVAGAYTSPLCSST